MISYHLLEHLRLQGFGTAIDTDLFWEKLPLDKTGVAIFSVGGARPYGRRHMSQTFDLECRGESDLLGMHTLEKIAEHFADDFVLCDLPTIAGVSNRQYKQCRIMDMTNIQNLGLDANDRVIFKITARIIYQKQRI